MLEINQESRGTNSQLSDKVSLPGLETFSRKELIESRGVSIGSPSLRALEGTATPCLDRLQPLTIKAAKQSDTHSLLFLSFRTVVDFSYSFPLRQRKQLYRGLRATLTVESQ